MIKPENRLNEIIEFMLLKDKLGQEFVIKDLFTNLKVNVYKDIRVDSFFRLLRELDLLKVQKKPFNNINKMKKNHYSIINRDEFLNIEKMRKLFSISVIYYRARKIINKYNNKVIKFGFNMNKNRFVVILEKDPILDLTTNNNLIKVTEIVYTNTIKKPYLTYPDYIEKYWDNDINGLIDCLYFGFGRKNE